MILFTAWGIIFSVKELYSNVGIGSCDLYEWFSLRHICRFPGKIDSWKGKSREIQYRDGSEKPWPAKHKAKIIWEPWEGCQAASYKTRVQRCRANCGDGSGGGISDGLGWLATRVSKFIKSDHDSCLIWQLGASTAIRAVPPPTPSLFHRTSFALQPCTTRKFISRIIFTRHGPERLG